MARHGRTAAQAAKDEASGVMPGGAAGVAQEPPPVGAPLADPRLPVAAQVRRGPDLQPEKWMVVDGPRVKPDNLIRYHSPEGYSVLFHPGKIVATNTHNLAHLRSQSIKLERVPDEVVEEEEVASTPTPEVEQATTV